MIIKDEQIYEASKEIMLKMMEHVSRWPIENLDVFARRAAKCAVIMADEIEDKKVKK